MNHLDLFSGIGGFSLGLERAGFNTVAFAENNEFCIKLLQQHWPDIPVYKDVRHVTKERLEADGITGIRLVSLGFPCQDLSVAGSQKGIEAERSGLWSEGCRIISELRPDYAIVENVTALLSGDNGGWFGRVLGDLAEVGYDAEWYCIPASELGANHHRDRVWIICYPQYDGLPTATERGRADETGKRPQEGTKPTIKPTGTGKRKRNEAMADSNSEGLQGSKEPRVFKKGRAQWNELLAGRFCGFQDISLFKPTIHGSLNGFPNYAHRIKGLGNAVCPPIVELLGRAIMSHENGG